MCARASMSTVIWRLNKTFQLTRCVSVSGEEVREEWCVIGELREVREVRERLSSWCHWYTGFI